MEDSKVLIGAACAFAGTLVSAVMGWLGSNEVFNGRKFGKSVLVSLVAGVTFGVGFEIVGEVTLRDYGMAFLSGAGADAVLNRFGKL